LKAFGYTTDVHDWPRVLNGKVLPLLETLELTRCPGPGSDADMANVCWAVDAPILHRLTFHCVLFPINAPTLRFLSLNHTNKKRDVQYNTKIKDSLLLSFLRLTPLLGELVLDDMVLCDDSPIE